MASARKWAIRISTFALFVLFSMAGTMKLTDALSPAIHQEMRSNFRQFSPVFPLAGLGVVPDPNVYRVAVGVTEVVCAILLYLGKKRVSYMASWVIVGLMVGALYTHYALHHPLHMMTAATVCLLLAVVRILALADKDSIKVKIG